MTPNDAQTNPRTMREAHQTEKQKQTHNTMIFGRSEIQDGIQTVPPPEQNISNHFLSPLKTDGFSYVETPPTLKIKLKTQYCVC